MSSGKKVFVGNLNYETNEDDLKSAFAKAGKVVDAKVVRRGSRSRGYGFVEFETEDQAKQAVELLDKFELNERSINVQVSTSTGTKTGNGGGSGGGNFVGRPRFRNNYRNFQGGGGGFQRDRDFQGGGGFQRDRDFQGGGGFQRDRDFQGGFQRPFRGRKVYHLRNNFNDNGPRRRNNGGRPMRRNYNNKPLQRKDNVEKIESKTTIFVANLPFSVDDEGLIELFTKCGPIRTAHVVRNKGRSKGFGFVEFDNQEGQTKALETMDNHPVPYKNGEQKALSVKVAMSELEKKETQTVPQEKTEVEDQ